MERRGVGDETKNESFHHKIYFEARRTGAKKCGSYNGLAGLGLFKNAKAV